MGNDSVQRGMNTPASTGGEATTPSRRPCDPVVTMTSRCIAPDLTTIRSRRAVWPANVWLKWDYVVATMPDSVREMGVQRANYFTPRPYRDEYNRATDDEGFVYISGRSVWHVVLPKGIEN